MEDRVTTARKTPVYREKSRVILYQGRFVTLLDIAYEEDEKEMHRHLLHEAGSGNGTYVVALTDDGMVVFNRQYRAGHGLQVEFSAGRPNPKEDPGKAALRELLEETGYIADKAILLGKGPVLSGTTLQITFFYLTRIRGFAGQKLEVYNDAKDEVFDEDAIETFLVPLEKAEAFVIGLLQTGSGDPKMLAALRLAMNYLQRSPTEYAKFWLKIGTERIKNRYNQLKQTIKQKIKKEKENVTTANI